MDIRSGCSYPASALSNFSFHPFVFEGVQCNSMEGLLQSFKFKDAGMQEVVCKLAGKEAKFKGKPKKWWKTQTLWWKGVPYLRKSQAYQHLLDRAYDALAENVNFRKALQATNGAVITHSLGKRDASHTVLTEQEFCSRLMKLREKVRKEGVEKSVSS